MTVTLVLEHAPHGQRDSSRRWEGGDLVIGRGDDAGWQIDDPDMFVSRRHCVISEIGGVPHVTDASRGGVFIDGASEPLGPGNSRALENGMRFRIGDFVIRVEMGGAAAPRTTAPLARSARMAFEFGAAEPEPERPARPDDLPDPFGVSTRGGAFEPRRAETARTPRPLDEDDPFALDLKPSTLRPADAAGDAAGRARPAPTSPFASSEPAPPRGTGPSEGAPTAAPSSGGGRAPASPFGGLDAPLRSSGPGSPFAEPEPAPPPPSGGSGRYFDDDAPAPRRDADAETAAPAGVSDPFGSAFGPLGGGSAAPRADARTDVREPPPPRHEAMPERGTVAPAVERTAENAARRAALSDHQPAAPAGPDLRAAFLRGAGLDPAKFPARDPEREMEELGERMRALVDGLMHMLRARAMEKQKVRVAQTVIGSQNVNPLKFLATPEDALAALVEPRGQGYLGPKEAIDGAFRDLADHQMRTWSALQQALRRMIDRFDPEAIETEMAEAGLMKALLAGGRSALLWQLYEERYKEIARSAEERFLGEVGADFRDAYEGQDRRER